MAKIAVASDVSVSGIHNGRVGAPTPREIAIHALRRTETPGDFLEHRLEADPGFRALGPADRRLAQELVFGVLRRQSTLDWLVARRTDGRRQRPDIRRLLHLGLYQIVFLDRIPDHAAVHETVELARRIGLGSQSGFVNAVLRGTLRDLPGTRQALAQLPLTDLATASSHPAWLIARWQSRLDPADLVRMLELNNTPPPTYARVNTLCTDAATLQQAWLTEGVVAEVRPFPWAEWATVLELKEHPSLAGLGSFQRGDFYVQDPSTLLPVNLLDPQPGETILDACAAPGGKTSLIAARMNNQGQVRAEDSHAERRRLLTENVARLGATCVTVGPAPGLESREPVAGAFDRVLVDVPCSNTGVLRRRVEARWRLQPESLIRIRDDQRQILQGASQRVRPGGVLVYSTCSLEPEENALAVEEFLQSNPGFTVDTTQEALPWRDEVDGAYAARLRREG